MGTKRDVVTLPYSPKATTSSTDWLENSVKDVVSFHMASVLTDRFKSGDES